MTAEPVVAQGTSLRTVLIVLCVTEITSWGVLYYAFPVLAPAISASTGWTLPELTLGFTLAQIAGGLVGVGVGRVLDRWGPRPVMSAGSLLAVVAVVVVATAQSLTAYFAGWLLGARRWPACSTSPRSPR